MMAMANYWWLLRQALDVSVTLHFMPLTLSIITCSLALPFSWPFENRTKLIIAAFATPLLSVLLMVLIGAFFFEYPNHPPEAKPIPLALFYCLFYLPFALHIGILLFLKGVRMIAVSSSLLQYSLIKGAAFITYCSISGSWP